MTVEMMLPHDLRPTIEITSFTLTSISTLVIGARFYCRIWVARRPKLHDYMTLVALLCTWGICVCNHYQVMFGTGSQERDKFPFHKSKEEQDMFMAWMILGSVASWYAYHIGYLFTLAWVKLSILVFYLSFATQRVFRILVYITIAIVAAVSIAMILIFALQCPKDPKYALSLAILRNRGAGHCFDLRIVFYWQAAFNMASDLVILVLPLPLFFRLHMHPAQRLSLLVVFSAGLLVPIASGIRFWGLVLWSNSYNKLISRYYGGYIIFWSLVEINTAIICASLPSLQPLFKQVFRKLPSLRRSREPYYYYGGGQNSMAVSLGDGAIQPRCAEHDSIIDLEHPAPTYRPKRQMQEAENTRTVIIQHLSNDEEVRERVRALSNHTPSVNSQSASLTCPSHISTIR